MNRYKNLVFAALSTALIIAGTYVRIPIGPVPIVLATVFVLLAGLLLDLAWAAASVLTFLLLGAVGLPVFSSGSGLSYFAGPAGGFLVGYLLSAVVVNLISTRDTSRHLPDGIAVVVGTIAIYLTGVPWLKHTLSMTWPEAFVGGLLPYLPGDALKAVVAYGAYTMLKRRYPELIPRKR